MNNTDITTSEPKQEEHIEWTEEQLKGKLVKTPSGWATINAVNSDCDTDEPTTIDTEPISNATPPNTPQYDESGIDTNDRNSEFAPEFPSTYCNEAETILLELQQQSDDKALIINTLRVETFITYDDGLVRWLPEKETKGILNRKVVNEGYKVQSEDHDDIVESIHTRLDSGAEMKLVPRSRLETQKFTTEQ